MPERAPSTQSASQVEYPTALDVKLAGKVRNGDPCPRADLHTPAPRSYLGWHDWAEKKGKTHAQVRCPGCTLFAIWLPKDLTPVQRRLMVTIRRMQLSADEMGHDAEGDLSLCTGNLTRVLRTLRDRGLIEPYEVREPDDYYTAVKLTPAGFEALRAA